MNGKGPQHHAAALFHFSQPDVLQKLAFSLSKGWKKLSEPHLEIS
jgi:hypothetical protein